MIDGISDIFGIFLANAQPKNKNLAILLGGLAIVASKGRASSSVLREDAYAGVKAASQYL